MCSYVPVKEMNVIDVYEMERKSRYVTLPWSKNFWMTTNR